MAFREKGEKEQDIGKWFSNSSNKGALTYKGIGKGFAELHSLKQNILQKLKEGWKADDIASNPDYLKNGQDQNNFDKYANIFGNISEEEKKERRKRFINWTSQQTTIPGEAIHLKSYSDAFRGKTDRAIARGWKTNIQSDMGVLVNHLIDVKDNAKNKAGEGFHIDTFKGFMGATKPHSNVRKTDAYKTLVGEEITKKDERINEYSDSVKGKYSKLLSNITTLESNQKKVQNKYNTAKKEYEARIKMANKQILAGLKSKNTKLSEDDKMAIGEYTGIDPFDYSGKEALTTPQYLEINRNRGVPTVKVLQKMKDFAEQKGSTKDERFRRADEFVEKSKDCR